MFCKEIKPEDQLSRSLPETICSLSKLMDTFLKNEKPVQFEKPLISVSYNNLVWNLALLNLAKQNFHIKYGFDKGTYQISKPCAFQFHTRRFLNFPPI